MIKKIVSFVAAVAITVTGISAIPSAMAEPQKMSKQEAHRVLTQFCATALLEYRRYGTTKFLDGRLKHLDQQGKDTIELVCYAYSRGYEDGREWSNVA